MYRATKNFIDRTGRGEIPTCYVVINTDKGNRIYSEKELGGIFNQFYFLANGSVRADGLVTAGNGISAISKSDKLKQSGRLDRTVHPRTRDVINSLSFKQKQNINIILDNSDNEISSLFPLEPFLTKQVWIYVGFENDNLSDHLILFSGKINQIEIKRQETSLNIEES